MFTKSKSKKTCRSTPVVIESKLKPLPNIGNASKVASSATCKNRNSTTVSKPCSRSERTGRSGSVTDRDTRPLRVGKVLHSLNKRPRDSLKYTTYGRSSDPSFEDPAHRPLLPDPYADLRSNLDGGVPLDPNAPWWLFLAEMKLQARRQAINLDSKPESQLAKHEDRFGLCVDSSKARKHDSKNDNKSDEENAFGRNNSKSEDDPKYLTENDELSANKSSEHKSRENNSEEDSKGKEDAAGQDDNDNDDDEDEEEDEMGLPQVPDTIVKQTHSQESGQDAKIVHQKHQQGSRYGGTYERSC